MLDSKVGLVINGTIEGAPECCDDFIAAVGQNVAESLLEKRCIYYTVAADLSRPAVFIFSRPGQLRTPSMRIWRARSFSPARRRSAGSRFTRT
jgi:hypothetical protein